MEKSYVKCPGQVERKKNTLHNNHRTEEKDLFGVLSSISHLYLVLVLEPRAAKVTKRYFRRLPALRRFLRGN